MDVNPKNTDRLQIESQRMEERLKMLKQMMSVEKSQREAAGNGHYWQSGKRGPLIAKKTNNTNKIERVKHSKTLKVKVLTGKESDFSTHGTIQCGQCDQYRASMICVECKEYYCNVCFVKFHHKGSLSNHHIRPLSKVKECSGAVTAKKDHHVDKGSHSLLVGTYDEDASAASFQEALLAWRKSNIEDNSVISKDICKNSCGIQVTDFNASNSNKSYLVDIQFTRNTKITESSYFEKLLLKKVKRNPNFFDSIKSLTTKRNETLSPEEDSSNQPYISPYNIFYSTDSNVLNEQQYQEHKASNDDNNVFILPKTPSLQQQSNTISIENLHHGEGTIEVKSENSVVQPTACIPTRSTSNVKTSKKIRATKKQKPKRKVDKMEQVASMNGVSEAVLTAVAQQAWKDVSHQTPVASNDSNLSSFFLTSVEPIDRKQESSTTPIVIAATEKDFKWNSSVLWQPDISRHDQEYSSYQDELNISQSDLPPPAVCQSALSHHYSDTAESECEDEKDEEITVYDHEDRESNDADYFALNELASELASMCTIDKENIQEEEEDDEERIWSRMTVDELVNEFDQFQDQIRHNDS